MWVDGPFRKTHLKRGGLECTAEWNVKLSVQAGESRGVGDAPRRGHTARQSRSERRWGTVTGGYGQFVFLCKGSYLRCRKNNFSGIYGGGMVSHILRYHFAPFIRFEMIKKERAPLREVFLRSGALLYYDSECCKSCYTDMVSERNCPKKNSTGMRMQFPQSFHGRSGSRHSFCSVTMWNAMSVPDRTRRTTGWQTYNLANVRKHNRGYRFL